MKLTLENIKKLRNETNKGLTVAVCDYVIKKWNEYENKNDIFLGVINYGCSSGIVANLVYYHDTLEFYEDLKNEINDLLVETLDACGCNSPAELFSKNWDDTDPLALECNNKNLLAWFGFEETTKNIANDFNIEW